MVKGKCMLHLKYIFYLHFNLFFFFFYSKTANIFEALGDLDELNAQLGIVLHYCQKEKNELPDIIEEIQSRLIDIGSAIATPLTTSKQQTIDAMEFTQNNITNMESIIDYFDNLLPPLKNFILPSGSKASLHLHLARTVARRAERHACTLFLEKEIHENIFIYLNRLSDFLFVAARYANYVIDENNTKEKIYKKQNQKEIK